MGHLAGAKLALYYLNKEKFDVKIEPDSQSRAQNPASRV